MSFGCVTAITSKNVYVVENVYCRVNVYFKVGKKAKEKMDVMDQDCAILLRTTTVQSGANLVNLYKTLDVVQFWSVRNCND